MAAGKKQTERAVADRRNFLKLAGASVVGTGAAVASATGAVAATSAEAVPGGDYRETDHVKRFYALAREF